MSEISIEEVPQVELITLCGCLISCSRTKTTYINATISLLWLQIVCRCSFALEEHNQASSLSREKLSVLNSS